MKSNCIFIFFAVMYCNCSSQEYDLSNESIASLSGRVSGKWVLIQDEVSKIQLMELEFKEDGKGIYQFYDDYKLNANAQYLLSCQPVPKLVKKKNEFYIQFTGMAGGYEKKIVYLDNHNLVLADQFATNQKFERLEK